MLATLKLHTRTCQCGIPIERYVGLQKPLRVLASEENGLQAFADTFIDAPWIHDHRGHKVIGLLLPEHRISPLHAGSTEPVSPQQDEEGEEESDDQDMEENEGESDEGDED